MHKTALIIAASLIATVAMAQDVKVAVPPQPSGEVLTSVEITVPSREEPLASAKIREDGNTDWILNTRVVALNQDGDPLRYEGAFQQMRRIVVTHEDCIEGGNLCGENYLTARGIQRMRCVLWGGVNNIAKTYVSEAAQAAWVTNVATAIQNRLMK